MQKESDFLIIGAGIIGLALAKRLRRAYPEAAITVIEKEGHVAQHSSGRNSGVLHAGFYYNADSLKARFTRDGNRQMREFCKQHKLGLNENGKVVVAKNEAEARGVEELYRRGQANGVAVSVIGQQALARLEPNAKTHRIALHSPTTATVDPEEVNLALQKLLEKQGVAFFFGEAYAGRAGDRTIRTQTGKRFRARHIINAAGLYADKIARDFGYSGQYTILPFKGLYLKYTGVDKPVRMNIYPVPNLKNPFLGVHFTVTVDGHVKIGPTSMPAFWRENYKGAQNFRAGEFVQILNKEAGLFIRNSFNFRALALDEIRKYNRNYFIQLATALVKDINPKGFTEWTKPGIRAQLLNVTTRELVQDFVVEGDTSSTHILNAVSPAFTSSFPFADWVFSERLASL